ncbi:hypothetical protein DFH27DRAFT_576416 [Peziza echinospora]|nr:hypothetical protein DFH27DRAFT_576416 [Peziza echinospora]
MAIPGVTPVLSPDMEMVKSMLKEQDERNAQRIDNITEQYTKALVQSTSRLKYLEDMLSRFFAKDVLPQISPDQCPGAFPGCPVLPIMGNTAINSNNTNITTTNVNNSVDNSFTQSTVNNDNRISIVFDGNPLNEEIVLKVLRHVSARSYGDFYSNPEGDEFLKKLAKEAAVESRRIPAKTKEEQYVNNDKALKKAQIALHDTIVLCDDSGSMRTGKRIQYLAEALKRIVSITTTYTTNNDGIALRWLNQETTRQLAPMRLKTTAKVDEIIGEMSKKMRGPTRLGTMLEQKILKPALYDKIDNVNDELKRPLLITIITDGDPFGEERHQLKQTILNCKERLRNCPNYKNLDKSVAFHIIQVGNSKKAASFLGDLRNDKELEKVITCPEGTIDEAHEDSMKACGQMSAGVQDAYEYWVSPKFQTPNIRI